MNTVTDSHQAHRFHQGSLLVVYILWVWTDVSIIMGFPGGTVAKDLSANPGDSRDSGLIPGLGRAPGEGNGSLLQYYCLENPIAEEPGGYSPWGRRVRQDWALWEHTHMHHHTITQCFHCPVNPLCSTCISLYPCKSLATAHLFTVSIVLPFLNVVQYYCGLSDGLPLLNNMHESSLQVFLWLENSFLF